MIGAILAGVYGDVAPQGDFESIQTVVLTGNQNSVEFTSIPSTYQHLQVRIFGRSNRPTFGTSTLQVRCNNVSTNSYSHHYILGDGSTAGSAASSTANIADLGNNSLGSTVSNSFGAVVVDVLDYKDTNKFTTLRALGGVDINGTTSGYGGHISLGSALFQSTAVIDRLTFLGAGNDFTQHSHFALYGIKG
jgi:hypothetical protein